MKKFEFKFQNVNGVSGNSLFRIIGDDVEVLENIWAELLGRQYDSRSGYGLMRERTDREVRLFEDFSGGLFGQADGIIILDTNEKKIYATNSSIEAWFKQVELLDGEIKRSVARKVADMIALSRKNSPLIIKPKILARLDEDGEEYYDESFINEEKETYGEYAGSYAQDVEGLSDNFINDVLDGDPDAYWNID